MSMAIRFVCAYCGKVGDIAVKGLNDHGPSASLFKRVGRNHYSGHLHYRCPACGIVHLVEPQVVLGPPGSRHRRKDAGAAPAAEDYAGSHGDVPCGPQGRPLHRRL